MKKVLFLALFVFNLSAHAGANDIVFTKRNAEDNGQQARVYASPVSDGFLTYSPVVQDVRWTTLGANLGITSGVLSASFSQANADWNASAGASFILNKPTIGSAASKDVASSGDASGAQVVVGSDTRLTNARAPVAHFHNASDIASGVLDDARIPSLAISKTSGLQAALDSKYSRPAGSTSQYVRGDGSLATFPALSIQRTRAQTNTSGAYTWTFPFGYAAGTTPIVGITVEDGGASFWNHQITTLTNTSVTIQLTKTTAVTLLGISVLGIASSPQAYVHLTAVAP